MNNPGLVEVPVGGSLAQVVHTIGGGFRDAVEPLALAVDGGMGGFLPPRAGTSLWPRRSWPPPG